MSTNQCSLWQLLRYFYWDMVDHKERQYYIYWLISQIPCNFGDKLRARFCARKFRRAGKGLTVSAGARFRSMENLEVGDNVGIGVDSFIQARGGITLGNNVMLGPSVKVWSTNHIYNNESSVIGEQGLLDKPVTIGNDVWLGSNVFIMPGVILPDGVVASAGAVINIKKYKPYSILAGNPARVVGFRDDE